MYLSHLHRFSSRLLDFMLHFCNIRGIGSCNSGRFHLSFAYILVRKMLLLVIVLGQDVYKLPRRRLLSLSGNLLLLLNFAHDVGDFWVSQGARLGLRTHCLLVQFNRILVVNRRACCLFLATILGLIEKDRVQSLRPTVLVKGVTFCGNVIWWIYPNLWYICYIMLRIRFLGVDRWVSKCPWRVVKSLQVTVRYDF